jgi:LEA14-like dessication related protein
MRPIPTALLLACTACGALPKPVEEPDVDVRGVSIESIQLSAITGHVDLDVFNPNGFGVPLRSGTWTLSVGDAHAVSGQFDLAQAIPARGTAPVRASLYIDAADAVAVGARITAGERRYTLRGSLTFSTRLGPITVDFAHEGRLVDGASDLGSPLGLFGALR